MPDSTSKQPGQPEGGGSKEPAQSSRRGARSSGSGAAGAAASSIDLAELTRLLGQLTSAGGLPISLSEAPPVPVDTTTRLNQRAPVTVMFPPCVEVLLSLIQTTGGAQQSKDDITLYFDEYFKFGAHQVLPDPGRLEGQLDSGLLDCLDGSDIDIVRSGGGEGPIWPPTCCSCPACVTLDGNRNFNPVINVTPSIRRLFIADSVWLFFFERMGIFRILGVVLDDYARRGRLAISNGSLDAGVRDDLVALLLEVMVRETKTGMSSTVRDRNSSYLRSLGWATDEGRRLKQETQPNTAFSTLFHKFIYHALEFYKDRRLAVAIRGTTTLATPPSAATLITISDTIDVLKKRFEVFDYGRNYYNTLNGIVWSIAGMSLIRELRTTLGIPPTFDRPHEYIPAAYDLLIAGRAITGTESNRYTLHRECARDARDILLDIEVLNDQAAGFADPGGELDRWLDQIEGRIEGYRTAYRAVTKVDLGESATAPIEQQV
jgi:hypothetical protein